MRYWMFNKFIVAITSWCICQIVMWYTLKLYNVACQLYLNKDRNKQKQPKSPICVISENGILYRLKQELWHRLQCEHTLIHKRIKHVTKGQTNITTLIWGNWNCPLTDRTQSGYCPELEWREIGSFHLMGCCFSIAKFCPTLCDPMDCNRPLLPVLYRVSEFAQTHIHWVGDAL